MLTIDPKQIAAHPEIVLPKLRAMLKKGLPHLLEGTLIPLAVFYTVLFVMDVWWALIGALTWSYLALARRMVRKQRVGGILIITALTLTIRAALTFLSGNVKFYFFQSTFAKVATSAAFLGSVWAGQPIIKRIAGDFIDLPPELEDHPVVKRCFARITILWAGALLVHGAVAVYLLLTQSIETYVLVKTFVAWGFEGGAFALSIWLARRSMRNAGIKLSFA